MHPEQKLWLMLTKFVSSTAKQKDLVEFDPNSITRYNENSTLRLACFDRCVFCRVYPQFAKDGIKLLPENDARVNITYYEETAEEPENRLVLTIKDLTLNDSGNYTCISSVDQKIFDEVHVTVNSKCAIMAFRVNLILYCVKQTVL